MTQTATDLFGTGLPAAAALRRQVLDALGAEPEWTVGDDDDAQIIWIAGPLPTFLTIEPVGELTPRLGVLTVRTRCAWVQDLDQARHVVADLNHMTTLNRWVLLSDPGPDGWWTTDEHAAYDWAGASRRQHRLASPPAVDATPSVEVGASFVVGDPAADLPLTAILAIVREQIAKATAVVTNYFADGWGEPAAVSLDDQHRAGDSWNDVVYHLDRHHTPYADHDPTTLHQALLEAFRLEREDQFHRANAAWFGSGDDTSFTCEVPYGPGPFPDGVIGMTAARGLEVDDANRTALLQASPTRNPHWGNGVLVTLRVPENSNKDEPWWAAALLNAQNRLNGGGNSSGTAHGLGAWAEHDGGLSHVLFLPVAWTTALGAEDLTQLLRQVLANAARLSWASRRVLEPCFDLPIELLAAGHPGRLSGLAAGDNARGPQFGEPGAGADPGARLLAFTWDNLVGDDHHWALTLPDQAGFDFWPNAHLQRIESQPCSCPDPGSRVTIETPLLTGLSEQAARHALGLQHEGLTAALTTVNDGQYLVARTLLHVHDDSYPWLRAWAPALAVAQALLAEQLDADPGGPADPARFDHPGSGPRPDRDQMLTLFDPGQDWLTVPGNPLTRDALALAPMFTEFGPYGCRWQDQDVLLDWPVTIRYGDESSQPCTVRTSYGPHRHPTLGQSLRVSTILEVDTPDPVSWCLELNAWLQQSRDSTVLGGVGINADGTITYTTLVPVAFDRSSNADAHASFIGTSLAHHTDAVASLLLTIDGVGAPALTPTLLIDGTAGLVDFYRQAGLDLPADLTVAATEGHGHLRVEVTRPWRTPGGIGEWPRLGGYEPQADDPVIRTVVPLDPGDVSAEALRLLHAAIIGAAKLRHTGTGVGAPLARAQHSLSPAQVAAVQYALVDEGVLTIAEDTGAFLISHPATAPAVPVQVDVGAAHPGWARATTITATLPDGLRAGPRGDRSDRPWVIGDWHEGEQGAAFRVCLPPAAFAVGNPGARQELLAAAIRVVATEVARAEQALQGSGGGR